MPQITRRAGRLRWAACALLIAPLVVAIQALPANAATGKLLVITRGHTGVVRASPIVVYSIAQNSQFQGTSGRAYSVPDGQYAVITGIDATTPSKPWPRPSRR